MTSKVSSRAFEASPNDIGLRRKHGDPVKRPVVVIDAANAALRHPALEHAPECERNRVLSAMSRTNWPMSQAAQQPIWSRIALDRELRKSHIVKSASLTRLSIATTSCDAPSVNVPMLYHLGLTECRMTCCPAIQTAAMVTLTRRHDREQDYRAGQR